MKVTIDEARRIAELAHLEFDDAGIEHIAADLTEILNYVDQLKEVDTSALAAQAETLGATPMREDVPQPVLDRELVAENAPRFSDGFFVVPKVIGGGS